MRKRLWMMGSAGLITALVISGCALFATPTPEPTATPTEEPTATATETETATPTETSTPTKTPTRTPRPTRTPTTTATATTVPTRGPTRTPDLTQTAIATLWTPTPTVPATSTQAVTPSITPTVQEFVPQGNSVWQLDNQPYATEQTPECPAPLHHDFYGLYVVSTVENGIQWRGQDGITYTLSRGNPNVYFGGGGSVLPGYNLEIVVVFNSSTSITVSFVLVDQNVAGCKHTYRYNGTFQWMA